MERVSRPQLSIDEKVKTVLVRSPILIRAISPRVRPVEVANSARWVTKENRTVVTRQPAEPLTVHNIRAALRAFRFCFTIAGRERTPAVGRREVIQL